MNYQLLMQILIVIVFVASVSWLFAKGYKEKVLQLVQHFVMEAEKELGSGTGPIKLETVLSWVYQSLPSLITFIIGKTKLKEYIQIAVDYIKNTKVADDITIEEYLSNLATKNIT